MNLQWWKYLIWLLFVVQVACTKAPRHNTESDVSLPTITDLRNPDSSQNSYSQNSISQTTDIPSPPHSNNETPQDAYLIRDSSNYSFYHIELNGTISIYASPEDREAEQAEIVIYPDEYALTARLFQLFPIDTLLRLYREKGSDPWPKRFYKLKDPPAFRYGLKRGKPLSGLRVALDPGHTAEDMRVAEIEGKYMKMRANPDADIPEIAFHEANLALSTAHLVRKELEKMGATVMMTRTKAGIGALGVSFEEWRQTTAFEDSLTAAFKRGDLTRKKLRWWRRKAPEKEIMKQFYTQEDLRARAAAINAFQPHLSLIIHYNVDAPNWEKRDEEGFFTPTEENYCMAFTPGSFMNGELDKLEDRLYFLRMLVSDDVDASVKLCHAYIEETVKQTSVPVVDPKTELNYLNRASILTDKVGVYARNLSLTRMIYGPLCYGESLCQDNRAEALALNQKDILVEGIPTSNRIEDIASVYVSAVLKFVKD